jgi:hypothetical protein
MVRVLFSCLVLVAAPLVAQPRDEKIDQVAADLRAIARVAALASEPNQVRQVLLAIVDADVEMLREKRPDETYRWASLQRVEAGRVSDEKAIELVHTEKTLREVTVSAPNAYRVEVTVPMKRSLFGANNRVYVRNVLVDSTGTDGKTVRQEIPVNAWVAPGDTTGVALAEIGKSVRATVELGVESGEKRAVATASLVQAKLVDDPASPYFPAVRRLLQIRDVVAAREISRGMLKSTADEALLSLPGEMEKRTADMAAAAERRQSGSGSGAIAAGDASPDVVAALQEVVRLLGGTLQDQTDARSKLQQLLTTLRPPPTQ